MPLPVGALLASLPGLIKAVSGLVRKRPKGDPSVGEWYPEAKIKAMGQIGAIVVIIVFALERVGAPVGDYPTLTVSLGTVIMFVVAWYKKGR